MTKKLKGMEAPAAGDAAALATYNNTFSRYVAIKEEEATKAKKELMILWTDYFKPEHLATFPDLRHLLESSQALQRLQGEHRSGQGGRADGCRPENPRHVLAVQRPHDAWVTAS